MSWLHIMIFIPFAFAIIVPLLYKLFNQKLHIGWLVLPIPILIFTYLSTYITTISNGESFSYTFSWIPSLDINFTAYLDGLSLIFGLIITGIGALVILLYLSIICRKNGKPCIIFMFTYVYSWAPCSGLFSPIIF